ncbi:hypothetical protein C9439_08165 [archaeon SCG-AAA382B04]|nr:hypothetical protein C9439_08165 [archaeon SCG-AAA382B04]
MKSAKKSTRLLLSLWSAWFFVFLVRMSLKAILPALKIEFNSTHMELGFAIAALITAYSLIQIPAGYLSDRFEKKFIIIPGMFLASLGIFLASFSQSIIVLIIFLFLTGLGLGTYYPAGIGLISNWFSKAERGKTIGFHETATSAGSVIGPALGGIISSVYGWRIGFRFLGLIGLLVLPLIYLFGNQKESNNGDKKFSFINNIRPLIPLIIIFTLTAASWMGFTTYLATYLTHIGYSEGMAGSMFSIMPAISLVSMPIAGHFSDKFSRKKMLIFLLLASSPFIYLVSLLSSFYLICISLAIIGLTMFAAYPVVITYISDKISQGVAGITFGFVNAISMGVSAIASPTVGYIIDVSNYRVAFLLISGLVIVSAIIISFEKEKTNQV